MTLNTYRGEDMVQQMNGIDLMEDAVAEVFWSAAKDSTLTRWELCMEHHMQIWERKIGSLDSQPKKKFPGPLRYPVRVTR